MVERAPTGGGTEALSLAPRTLRNRRRVAAAGKIRAGCGQPVKHFLALFVLLGVLAAQPVRADELRPGYLELRQTTSDTYSLLFKIPARGEDMRLAIYLKFPDGTSEIGAPRAFFGEGAYTERRTIRRDGGLTGRPVTIEGLSA